MKLLNDHRTFKVLAVFWMTTIFWLSSIPDLPAPSFFSAQDKLAHVLVFGVLGFFFSRSFRLRDEDLPFTRVLLVTLMVALYGGFDETHQLFVPGREASLGDLAADTVGGFLAGLFFWKR
jgi:VanZ family protein